MRKFAAVAAAAALLVAGAPSGTALATEAPVLSGTGWEAATHNGITSIDPGRHYRITFTTEKLRHRFAPHLAAPVEHLQDLGVNIEIAGVTNVDASQCPSSGVIQFDEVFQPLGKQGYSRALPCHDTDDGSAWGGHVLMDSEYWDGSNPLSESLMANTFAHELMHVMGLAHPNKDLDGNGEVEPFECAATSYGNTPTMCSPNGGYEGAWAGKPGYYDRQGIAQLLANFPTA